MARTRPSRRTDLANALSVAAVALLAGGVFAQSPSQFSGKDFAGVRFTQSAATGEVAFKAARAYSFDEGGCKRLVLIGDVQVRIAGYDLRARRAAVWMQPQGAGGAQQIYIFLDEFGGADESVASATFSARQLPVKAVVIPTDGIHLHADLLKQEAPSSKGDLAADAKFTELAEKEFAKSLLREVNPAAALEATRQEPQATPIIDPRIIPQRERERAERRAKGLADPYLPPPPPPPARPVRSAPETSPLNEPTRGEPAPSQPRPRNDGRKPPEQPTRPSPRPSESETPSGGGAVAQKPTTAAPGGGTPTPATTRQATGAESAPTTGSAAAEGAGPIFSSHGVITISPQNLTYISGEEESSLLATGGVTVQYSEPLGRVLQMTAQRVVVFFEPGKGAQAVTFTADSVRGIYLEGDVQATDGKYTIRGPQMYYDVAANRAVSIDAVFWTYDESRKLPLYVRAKAIHQEAAAQFTAKDAKFTNSAFFDPELSIGASSVTISRQSVQAPKKGEKQAPPPTTRTIIEADNIVSRFAGLPVFYWPHYKGDPERFPIKDFRVENFSGSGAAVRATFDIYSLAGIEKNKRFQADLLTDFYVERGLGLGTKLGWETDDAEGSLLAWGLLSDRGIDVMKPGTQINHDGEFRGVLLGEHRQKLDDKWTLLAEVAVLSDEAVIDAFFEGLGETRREFTNRVAARRIDKNTVFSAEMKGSVNDFISNEYLLQSRGYSVTKTPELTYSRLADDLIPSKPGLLTYFSEYRAGYMFMNFDERDARDHGLTSNTLAQRALGINMDQKLGDALRASGLDEDGVLRADTRHELNLSTNAGAVKLNPFVVARGTGYDREFDDYAPDQSDSGRLWTAAGVRVSTTVQRVYEDVDSRLLDVHRLRHIIEPNATIWASGTTLESSDMPTYDERVEALADGTMLKIGMKQVLQTQRGGAGEWHNTDVLVLTTDYVWSSDDTPRRGPIGRFVDYRPELSSPGEFFVSELAWRTTDSLTVTGASVFDLERNQQALTSVGTMVQHNPQFATVAELRYLNAQNSTIVTLGAHYMMTSKYDIFAGADYDVDEGGFQNTSFEVHRRFPSATFGLGIGYNDITGESSLSFVFRPSGAASDARFSGIGSSNPTATSSGF